MTIGKVKFVTPEGWGIITLANGKEASFTAQECSGGVAPPSGTTVRFTLVFGPNGKRKAVSIKAVKIDFDWAVPSKQT